MVDEVVSSCCYTSFLSVCVFFFFDSFATGGCVKQSIVFSCLIKEKKERKKEREERAREGHH